MNTKGKEARFVADLLAGAGVEPWIIDLSLRPHGVTGADVTGEAVAQAAGSTWAAVGERSRQDASALMAEGGGRLALDRFARGELAGAIGLGGANGTTMGCAIMRALPYLLPKVMVSTVAGTAAVQWYVAESDIAMYPAIGDVALNRITKTVMEYAAQAVALAAKTWVARRSAKADRTPLIAVSSFGGTSGCVDRVCERLDALGYEFILFHASGVGGKSLERLAASGELAGVIDVTTHELADLVVDGVYSAGQGRLTGAGQAGLPQVIVPGAVDHSNFWVGQVPERYRGRDFFRYNAQNLLMRTDRQEFVSLANIMAERINAAKGPTRVLIPLEGFSEHTKRHAHDLDGKDRGPWKRPDDYRMFTDLLKQQVKSAPIDELPLHVNDPRFADACVDAFLALHQPKQ